MLLPYDDELTAEIKLHREISLIRHDIMRSYCSSWYSCTKLLNRRRSNSYKRKFAKQTVNSEKQYPSKCLNKEENSTSTLNREYTRLLDTEPSVPTANTNYHPCDYFNYTVGCRELEMKIQNTISCQNKENSLNISRVNIYICKKIQCAPRTC
jgi:hypothetical protein